MWKTEESGPIKAEELVVDHIDHSAKRIQAFLLALIFYCLFISFLFVDMRTSLFLTLPEAPLSRLHRDAHQQPAPVRWAQPPPPTIKAPPPALHPSFNATPPAARPIQPTPTPLPQPLTPLTPPPPPIAQPAPQPITLPPAQEGPSTIHREKEGFNNSEKKTSPNLKQNLIPQNEMGKDSPTRDANENLSKQSSATPTPQRALRRRRSFGESWIKKPVDGVTHEKTLTKASNEIDGAEEGEAPLDDTQERAENWDRSFRGYLDRRYGKQTSESSDSRTGQGNGTQTPASATGTALQVGHELFVNKLVRSVCDTSNNRPLQISFQSVPLHIIMLWITITRNRTISELSFEEKSPYPFINHYIEELIRTTPMPQLPYDWHEESLTIPLRVRIEVRPDVREIRLVPASW